MTLAGGRGSTSGLALAMVALLAGCATTMRQPPAPTPAEVATVQAAVGTARASGAERDERALHYLRLAELQLAQARERTAKGENREARLLLRRATADAELSQVLLEQARAVAEARTAEEQLGEARRTGPGGR